MNQISSIIDSVPRGERRRTSLEVPGCEPLDLWILRGERDGKTLVVTSGVHGCEYLGPGAALRAARTLDPKAISGSAVFLPMINPSGFYLGAKQIMPEDGKNLNREFPGDAEGTYSQRVAAAIEREIYPLADFLADLHGGDVYEELTPLIFFPAAAGDYVGREALLAARSLSAPLLVASAAKNGLYSRAAQLGIPSLLLERGCRGEWSARGEEEVFYDIMRLLAHLGITDEQYPRAAQTVVKEAVYEEAPSRGCWRPAVHAGEKISRGQKLGELRTFDGELIKDLASCADGIVMYVTVALGVTEGDSLVSYAML